MLSQPCLPGVRHSRTRAAWAAGGQEGVKCWAARAFSAAHPQGIPSPQAQGCTDVFGGAGRAQEPGWAGQRPEALGWL